MYILNNSIKLLGLMIGVVVLNIVILSPGLLGITIGGESALQTASGVTLLLISLLVLLYGSYVLLFKPPVTTPVQHIRTHEEYIAALHQYRNIEVLKMDMQHALDQLERMEKKKNALLDVLSQRFDVTELSYRKFHSVIHEVEKLFYLNIRGILNKLSVFDATDFSKFAKRHQTALFSNTLVQARTALYQEYLTYMAGYIHANEEILLKLDKLLVEISLLGSTDYKDVEEMPCMKEIDLLIQQTKFYKQ